MSTSYCTAWSPKQHGRGRNSYLGDVIPLTAIWENDLMWVQEDFISKTTRKIYLLERELKVYDLGVPLVQSLLSRTYFAVSRKSGSLPD